MEFRSDRRRYGISGGFTLVEALLAVSLVSLGVSLLWDGYVGRRKLDRKLAGQAAVLDEIAEVSESLSRDLSGAASARLAGPGVLEIGRRDAPGIRYRWDGGRLRRAGPRRERAYAHFTRVTFQEEIVQTARVLWVHLTPRPAGNEDPGPVTLLRVLPGAASP